MESNYLYMKSNYLYMTLVSLVYKKRSALFSLDKAVPFSCFLRKKLMRYKADLLTLFFGFLLSFSADLAPGWMAI